MKELLGKVKLKPLSLPLKIIVNKADLLDDTKMAHELNSFITDVEKSLTSKIRNASTLFKYSRYPLILNTRYLVIFHHLEHFFGPSRIPSKCPYKFVRYLEPSYLKFSSCRTILSVHSMLLRLFSIKHLERFHFTHWNVEIIHLQTFIECLSLLILTRQHVAQAKA